MKRFFLLSIILLVTILLFNGFAYAWQRSALVSPIRVVIDRKKTANVKIINTTDLPTTYRIEIVSMEMDENSVQYEPKELNPHAVEAIKMIKFSPRRISLKPGAMQTIRIMARKRPDLPAGEYRCHLKVSPLPPPAEKTAESDSIGFDINYLINTTIPVIIRHGKIDHSIKVINVGLQGNKAIVSISRTGKKSGLFDIEVLKKNRIIAKRERVAFYYPNKDMKIEVKLESLPKKGEEIKIRLIGVEAGAREVLDNFSTII